MLPETGSNASNTTMGQGFKLMIKDVKVWIMMLNHLLITICASFTK